MNFTLLFLDPSHVAPKTWNPKPPRGPAWPTWRRDVPVLAAMLLGGGLVAFSVSHQPAGRLSAAAAVTARTAKPALAESGGQVWQPAPAPRNRAVAEASAPSLPASVPPAPMTDMPLFDDGRIPAP